MSAYHLLYTSEYSKVSVIFAVQVKYDRITYHSEVHFLANISHLRVLRVKRPNYTPHKQSKKFC